MKLRSTQIFDLMRFSWHSVERMLLFQWMFRMVGRSMFCVPVCLCSTLRRLCSDVLNADKTPADQATHAIEKCLLDNEDKMRAQSRGGRSCREALEARTHELNTHRRPAFIHALKFTPQTKLKGQASDIRLDPTVNKAYVAMLSTSSYNMQF